MLFGLQKLWRIIALLALLVALGGCEAPDIGGELAGKVGVAAKDEPGPVPTVDVAVAEQAAPSHFEQARQQLRDNYREFLEREPVHLDAGTLGRVGTELADAWLRATEGSPLGDAVPRSLIPLLLIALVLAAVLALDRQTWRLAARAQARVNLGGWRWLESVTRTAVVVAGRVAPVLLLVGFSYFPLQAVFRTPWSAALTGLLWVFAAYRAVRMGVDGAFTFGVFDVSDEDAARLQAFARRTARLIFGALAVWTFASSIAVAGPALALLEFAVDACVLVVPVYLLFIKPSVLALFPTPEGGLYARLVRTIERYYHALMLWSALLLGLRAAGYVYASTFILVRGYGLLLLFVATVGGGLRLRRWLEGHEAKDPENRDLLSAIRRVLRVVAVLTLFWATLQTLRLWEPAKIVLEIPLLTIGDTTISAYSVLRALTIVLGAVVFSRVVRAALVLRVFPAFDVDVGVGYAVQTLINYALVVVGFFVALIALGVNLSALTVVVASLGVGIGFGLQTITENLISGFILLFGRSVKKGDIVTVGDNFGRVVAVGARSVQIKTTDNFDLLIPSKEVVGGSIVNWSYADSTVRLRLPVGVTYSCSPREVEQVLLAAARKHERVLADPPPEVWLDSFGDSSVNFTLLVFFDCRHITRDRLRGQLNFLVWDALAEAKIEIPFPQRDLHIKSIDVPLPTGPRPGGSAQD